MIRKANTMTDEHMKDAHNSIEEALHGLRHVGTWGESTDVSGVKREDIIKDQITRALTTALIRLQN